MILYIRQSSPGFPATAQHPDAKDATIAGYYVVYLGTLPTEAEVLAIMTPSDSQKKAKKKARLKKILEDTDDFSLLVRALLRVIVAAPNNLNQARQALLDAIDAETP